MEKHWTELNLKRMAVFPMGLVDYPNCEEKVKTLAEKLWGSLQTPETKSEIKYGKGSIFWGGNLSNIDADSLYPEYERTVEILSQLKIQQDFSSANNTIRTDIARSLPLADILLPLMPRCDLLSLQNHFLQDYWGR